jgi:hypothetical protein
VWSPLRVLSRPTLPPPHSAHSEARENNHRDQSVRGQDQQHVRVRQSPRMAVLTKVDRGGSDEEDGLTTREDQIWPPG